jgi:hypothetical protein
MVRTLAAPIAAVALPAIAAADTPAVDPAVVGVWAMPVGAIDPAEAAWIDAAAEYAAVAGGLPPRPLP